MSSGSLSLLFYYSQRRQDCVFKTREVGTRCPAGSYKHGSIRQDSLNCLLSFKHDSGGFLDSRLDSPGFPEALLSVKDVFSMTFSILRNFPESGKLKSNLSYLDSNMFVFASLKIVRKVTARLTPSAAQPEIE